MDGEVVLANTEMGFWSTSACATYPNPLFVKLARSVWQIAPSFTFVGECHWGRAASLVRSGLVPHTLDIAKYVSYPAPTLACCCGARASQRRATAA